MNKSIIQELDSNCTEAQEFCDSVYDSMFAPVFSQVTELHKRMKSSNKPISDEELTYILTELPLDLFSVSESLNKLRLKLEVTKLENSKREIDFRNSLAQSSSKTTEQKSSVLSQLVKDELVSKMTEYRIFEICYTSIITRVENQLTYSRELIMGAKKIWDARRSAEASNPIGPVNMQDLPPYPC